MPVPFDQHLSFVKEKIASSLSLLSSVDQSAQSMIYYNSNQIARMQIKKNQLKIKKPAAQSILMSIQSVAYPFEVQIQRKGINVYVLKRLSHTVSMDFNLYELVLFNIF